MAPDLKRYRAKRDFTRTGEPAGADMSPGGNLFMIHKHDATRLHYDLRLQIGGVLKSWAVPKGPSLDPAERRLAVEVEEHPLEYGAFEGVIPEGQYGAGPTLIWDSGTWAPMGDIESSLKSGTLKFRLAGEKLKGGWTLARLKRRDGETRDNWLLIKEHDDAASTEIDILKARPESVVSGMTVEELMADTSAPTWNSSPAKRGAAGKRAAKAAPARTATAPAKPSRLRPGELPGAAKRALPRSWKPQLATPAAAPPEGEGWVHEIKFDGYRTIAILDAGKARLLTRNGHDWTARYGELAGAFAALPCAEAVIDGEIVVLDAGGVSRFGALQDALAQGETWRLVFYAFDLMHLNGWDLAQAPLSARKQLLDKLLAPAGGPTSAIQLSEHVAGRGADLLDRASDLGLEGVISKRVDAAYRQGRSKSWIKCKARRGGVFTIVGYTTSKAAGGLAALLLAEEADGVLTYAGKVGTGFSAAEAEALTRRLAAREVAEPSVEVAGPAPKTRWVRPGLKAKVQYSDRTRDNNLRHPVYRGLREAEFSGADAGADADAGPAKRYITDAHLASIWVTNPDRRMFSRSGPTKLDLAVYYARVGDAMLPHLLARPVSLVRCPTGKAEDCFFQRHAFSGMPAEVGTFVSTPGDGEERDYLVVQDAGGFLALAQFGVVEFHPWGCRTDKPERPDRMFFDLDPGEDVPWREVVAAAQAVRAELAGLGLTPFAKTTGGKGIHVVVPLKRLYSWQHIHQVSGKIAAALARREPGTFTTLMAKDQRKGRIFIDFHRNARSATAVAAYSLRARAGLPASAPVAWRDLDAIDAPGDLNYASLPVLLSNSGDPWANIEASACALGKPVTGALAG